MEPSYRITTEYDPLESPLLTWQARVVRLSDGNRMRTCFGTSEAEALVEASRFIQALNAPGFEGHVYYADELGNLDPATPASGTPVTA